MGVGHMKKRFIGACSQCVASGRVMASTPAQASTYYLDNEFSNATGIDPGCDGGRRSRASLPTSSKPQPILSH